MPNATLTIPRPILLVHGAWHGAWCWSALQAELDRRGVPSYSVDLPGHGNSLAPFGGLHDDANHVRATLDQLRLVHGGTDHVDTDADTSTDTNSNAEPDHGVILVGHSYGGAVITQAALNPDGTGRPDISHLVYLAAFALDQGESVVNALRSYSERPVSEPPASDHAGITNLLQEALLPQPDGSSVIAPHLAADVLYADCTPLEVQAAIRRLCPQPAATMTESPDGNPRATIPSTYVNCLRDRAIDPGHQSLMAQRCSESIELDADHSPFMSQPEVLAEILERIAKRAPSLPA